jgi:hypothetical protein
MLLSSPVSSDKAFLNPGVDAPGLITNLKTIAKKITKSEISEQQT